MNRGKRTACRTMGRGCGFRQRTTKVTILTNDPDAISRFVQQANGPCVYKAFRSPHWKLVETRLIGDDDLLRLRSLLHAPVIVQRYIPRGRDIRVVVIDDRVFCAAAVVRREEAAVDWRIDPAVTWEAIRLPASVERTLVAKHDDRAQTVFSP